MQQQCEEHLPQEQQQQKLSSKAKHQLPKPVQSMVLGSSIIKHVRGGKINKYSGKWSKIFCYPGAGSEKVIDHAEVEIKYALPETAIIYCGAVTMTLTMAWPLMKSGTTLSTLVKNSSTAV